MATMSAPVRFTAAEVQTVMDVGMHLGKDTEFYLQKGFHVIAVEARPDFVASNRRKFNSYISQGRLEIVNCAVAANEETVPLYVFPEKDDWATIDPRYLERNVGRGKEYQVIHVPGVRFDSILRRYGIPYYLKIDIEGADMMCVKALHGFVNRPMYLSLELTTTAFDHAFDALANLYSLGYRRFKLVNQALNHTRVCPNPPREGAYVNAVFDGNMSGPFGEEAPGAWRNAEQTLRALGRILRVESLFSPEARLGRYRRYYNAIRRAIGAEPVGWYDLHARYGS
jgi:FkbM family methyltransferase